MQCRDTLCRQIKGAVVLDVCNNVLQRSIIVPQQDISMLLEVQPDAPVGDMTTTFTLMSNTTIDTGAGNNEARIILTVNHRADLKISLYNILLLVPLKSHLAFLCVSIKIDISFQELFHRLTNVSGKQFG